MVPDTQSIDGSPPCPTVAPIATQSSQARQRLASQALTKTIGQAASHLQPDSTAASSQQRRAPRHASCAASNGTGANKQTVANSSQGLHRVEKASTPQQEMLAPAGASVVSAVQQTQRSRSRSRSRRELSQEPVASRARHAHKRASCDMTADISLRSAGEHGASVGREGSRQHKRQRRESCSWTPDAANIANYPKFQPPICDSQPKEVNAIVSSKRRRITATAVQTNSRSQYLFKMAGLSNPVRKGNVCHCHSSTSVTVLLLCSST